MIMRIDLDVGNSYVPGFDSQGLALCHFSCPRAFVYAVCLILKVIYDFLKPFELALRECLGKYVERA